VAILIAPAFEYAAGEVPCPGIERQYAANRFIKGKLLGTGTFGQVYECRDTITKGQCAIKYVQKRGLDFRARLHLRREIEIQTFLDHKKHRGVSDIFMIPPGST